MKTFCLFFVGIVLVKATSNRTKVNTIFNAEVVNSDMYKSRKNARITGGWESVPHSRPYQVGLILSGPSGDYFACGGSLITLQTVLTAAHCVESITPPVTVVLGAHLITQYQWPQVRIQSNKIYIHPRYSPRNSWAFDAALIHLPRKVQLNAYIQTIPIPKVGSTDDYTNKVALISGWGRTYDYIQALSPVLREVTAKILNNRDCSPWFHHSIQYYHICASGEGRRSINYGDSGGPMVVDGVQVGIASFIGWYGTDSLWPHVFTRISAVNEWIVNNQI